MKSEEFMKESLNTEALPTELPVNDMTLRCALHLAVAASDVMDQMKKLLIYGKPVDMRKLREQMDELSASADGLIGLIDEDNPHFESPITNKHVNVRLLHAAIGMFTEAGEMIEALLRQLNGMGLDKVNFGEELGDSDWYKAIAHDEIGITEETCRETVIAKLKKRYPNKFNSQDAINRDLTAERQVLETGLAQ